LNGGVPARDRVSSQNAQNESLEEGCRSPANFLSYLTGHLGKTPAEQNSVIGKQQKRIDALAAGLQKVSARTDLHQNRRKVANNE